MEGTRLSHYEVLERLGSGGMGTVYRARDTRLDREVALKVLTGSAGHAEHVRERFTVEARAASKIDHPNVCAVYDIGEKADGNLFISMGLCRGETLESRLRKGPLSIEDAIVIARQVAGGLTAAHAEGVIHRDVKPSNIIIDDARRVKIVDFGIAKLADSQLTRDGASLGTTAYMAPEQIRAEEVDARADIWGFGVMLFQMLSARRPFEAPYEQAQGYRILHEDPDPLEIDLREPFAVLAEIIEACLQKNPEQRPQSMASIAEALDRLARDVDHKHPASFTAVRPGLLGGLRKSQSGLMASMGIGAVLIFLVAGILIGGSPPLPLEKYLVVLPLSTVGDVPDDQLLADGLTVTLSNKLAQLTSFTNETFWVVPQTEVRSLGVDAPSSARRLLGATLAVEGNLIREATGIRLTMSLIDTGTLKTLRALDFSIPYDQMDRLQNEAASRVAGMMSIELRPDSRGALEAGRTQDPEAYDLYLRGLAYLERYELKENLEAAVDLFRRATALDQSFGAAFAAKGDASWRLYEHTKDELYVSLAVRYLEQALAIDPRLGEARVTLARVYSGTDRLDEARAEIEHAIALEPASVEALLVLARLHDRAGRIDEAEHTYREAIEMRPSYWAAYNQFGAFLNRRGRYEEALTQFNRVVLLTPDNVRGHSNLGATYFQLDRLEEAAASFETSLELEPTYVGYSNLASLYYFIEEMEKAAATYQSALEIEDGDYRLWLYLSSAFERLHQEDEAGRAHAEAIHRAKRQIQLNPGDQRTIVDLASMFSTDEPDRARTLLDELSRQHIEEVEVQFIIGEVYEALGEQQKAIEWICRSLKAGYSRSQLEMRRGLASVQDDPAFHRAPECAGLE